MVSLSEPEPEVESEPEVEAESQVEPEEESPLQESSPEAEVVPDSPEPVAEVKRERSPPHVTAKVEETHVKQELDEDLNGVKGETEAHSHEVGVIDL